MPTVNYLRVVGCDHVAAKGAERNEGRLQDRPPKQQEKPMKTYLCINKLRYQDPKITNSTSTDVTFGGAQSSRMVAKTQGYHSIAPADKQINEKMAHPTSPLLDAITNVGNTLGKQLPSKNYCWDLEAIWLKRRDFEQRKFVIALAIPPRHMDALPAS